MKLVSPKIDALVQKNGTKPKKMLHATLAFLFGGSIGLIAQGIFVIYSQLCKMSENDASILVSLTMIFLAIVFTAIGIFDNLARHAGAGTFIPIIGFANAMSSSAIEGRSEGPIFGIGGKIFSLVGSVFAYGILTSCFCGLIYFLMWVIK